MVGRQQRDMERRYSVAEVPSELNSVPPPGLMPSASEDLHAWSIYRQNLNSDFTDSALGSSEKSPLPYGNFQLRESTVQSILSHPRYGPKSALGSNMYTYLKFGLPRVFPPNGPGRGREGSSGYDSSDDGVGGTSPRSRTRPHSSYHLNPPPSYYLRTRSDPDFRNTPYIGPSMRQQIPVTNTTGRGKSVSEANLLAPEVLLRQGAPYEHRRSVHDLRGAVAYSELGPPLHMMVHHPRHGVRPASVAVVGTGYRPGSQSVLDGPVAASMLNVAVPHGPPGREPTAMSFQVNRSEVFNGQYPHLQVRGLDVDGKNGEPLLQSVSMEVRAGEILAVMATQVDEGRAVLDVLAGERKARTIHTVLNGQSVSQRVLKKRLAYVHCDAILADSLSVAQTLMYYSRLRRPPRGPTKVSTNEQMGLLVEELGLAQVLDTKVASLTPSETQRLNLACHLVADPDILVLDRPTSSMDIFDTFFLVEFLRQWAGGSTTGGLVGRVVIMTIQPPTYEIFTMVSRVLLLSGGRMMYSGRRRDMLPYFSAADYPCPAFKNPSDYYLDLVTLDDLSAEAMLESSQRIEQLAELFRRRQEPLSDPGPPQALPGKIRTANLCSKMIAVFLKHLVYSQPSTLTNWLSHLLLAATLSLLVGAVFWDLPRSDPQLLQGDRIGYHYTMMCIASWPVLYLVTLSRAHRSERLAAEADIYEGLYSRFLYITMTTIINLPASLVIWLAYIIPAYAMTGLYNQGSQSTDAFFIYIGYMLVEMMSLQYLLQVISHIFKNRRVSSIISIFVLSILALVSGYTIHLKDLQDSWERDYLGLISSSRWMLTALLSKEYSADALASSTAQMICRNKQVQRQDIIVQLPCPTPNGTAALTFHGLSKSMSAPFHFINVNEIWPPLIISFFGFLLAIITFLFLSPAPSWKMSHVKKQKMNHH
ncbi:ATP-binding cassette sub-family G member 5 [Lycorma delicatula]|uniref:ATP-binding cassette sub-family G member 5 n=1 Tax=Lycorma delicatula TaxID=130591 RepID=UPI003F510E79